MEIVRRIDALFEIERSTNGQNADQRKAVCQAQSAPLVADLEAYKRLGVYLKSDARPKGKPKG
jgi:hypothetical protein